jgi:hypothetical protein
MQPSQHSELWDEESQVQTRAGFHGGRYLCSAISVTTLQTYLTLEGFLECDRSTL